jgi:hypothetical protein
MQPGFGEMGPAVHRYLVAAQDESSTELFGECLETAVSGWNPPRPHDRDAHRQSPPTFT